MNPVDANAVEIDDWAERAAALRDDLVAAGKLRSPQRQSALLSIPRHRFVPAFYQRRSGGPGWELISAVDEDTRQRWRDAAYANTSLVTQIGQVPDAGRDLTGPTSSASAPSLVTRMLETLDVRDGHRVLEIGTGTGYNAALLCHRLGDANVFSVDIDADLVEQARHPLAALGYRPTLAAADGAAGLPEHAPYDRIIVTCAVPSVPWAWAEQTTLGARVLVDIKVSATVGNLVLLHRKPDRLEGPFDGGTATFMQIRSPAFYIERKPPVARDRDTATRRTTSEMRQRLWENAPLWFLIHLGEPGRVDFSYAMDPDTGGPGAEFYTARDGSWCELSTRTDRTRLVWEGGPRPLWTHIEETIQLWRHLGEPGWDRFGVSVFSEDHQIAWVDRPDSRHHWALPNPMSTLAEATDNDR